MLVRLIVPILMMQLLLLLMCNACCSGSLQQLPIEPLECKKLCKHLVLIPRCFCCWVACQAQLPEPRQRAQVLDSCYAVVAEVQGRQMAEHVEVLNPGDACAWGPCGSELQGLLGMRGMAPTGA